MVRRVFVLCLGAALAAGLTILGYVGVDTVFPSPDCSLENCNLPIILLVVAPGAAAVITLVLVRLAGAHASRAVFWLLGSSASVAAMIFEFPRALQEPGSHREIVFLGAVFLHFVLAPGATALLTGDRERSVSPPSAPDEVTGRCWIAPTESWIGSIRCCLDYFYRLDV